MVALLERNFSSGFPDLGNIKSEKERERGEGRRERERGRRLSKATRYIVISD